MSDLETRRRAVAERLARHRQDHVLRFFGELDPSERAALLDQIEAIDLDLIDRLAAEVAATAVDPAALAPPDVLELPADDAARRRAAAARARGEAHLRAGKVAALVVAGGQGSRLGFDGPKGCFPVGPVTGCSLFEWHCAKVAAMRRRYGSALPLLVMTSRANHAETRAFFERHRYFGLPEADVLMFSQGMLPAIDFSGRLLLESKSSLALAPDGHGGALSALERSGALAELERRGIDQVFYFQVDNPLVKVLDAEFVGAHLEAGSEMSSKVCAKRDAAEKVGVFARLPGGETCIVEYSDLPKAQAEATDATGRLRFRAGNIAIHVLAVDFVKRLTRGGLKLPYHRAEKAIPHVGASGDVVRPASRNGIKFETFVFDALPLARRALVVETPRAEDFSPIKNAEGEDSPATARADLSRLFRSWIDAAGLHCGAPDGKLEIAPTFALDAAEFAERIGRERKLGDAGLWLA